jgi:hypothetical protein
MIAAGSGVGVGVGIGVPPRVGVGVADVVGVAVGTGVIWAWTGSTPISTIGSLHLPGSMVEAVAAPPAAASAFNNRRRLTALSWRSSCATFWSVGCSVDAIFPLL